MRQKIHFLCMSVLTLTLCIVASTAGAQMMMGNRGMTGSAWGRGGMMGPGYWGGYGGGYGYGAYPGASMSEEDMQAHRQVVEDLQQESMALERMLAEGTSDKDALLAQQKKVSELRARLEELQLEQMMDNRDTGQPPYGAYGYGAGGGGRGWGAGPGWSRWGGAYGSGFGYGPGYGYGRGWNQYGPGYMPSTPSTGYGVADTQARRQTLQQQLAIKQKEMSDLLAKPRLDRDALQQTNEEIARLQQELDALR